MTKAARVFESIYRDLLDKSAKRNDSPLTWKAISNLALIIISTLLTLLNFFKEFIINVFGVYPGFVSLVILLLGFVFCFYIVTSKQQIQSMLASESTTVYKFQNLLRQAAKGGWVIVLFIMARTSIGIYQQAVPLPTVLYGYVYDVVSGDPVIDSRIRIITDKGVDITMGEWRTDSKGFYIIRTSKRPKRTAHILIINESCKTEEKRALTNDFEIKDSSTNYYPIFQHTIKICINEK